VTRDLTGAADAVVGVAAATQQLQTGQRVRVDSENGLVVPP
jgi:hypothetical protein